MRDFLFYRVELQEEQDRLVEILRTGSFVDRNGKEVAITEADLDEYITNFQSGKAGQDVPIDINHEREEAGGWIKALWRDGDKLLAQIDWNELGRQLVGDKVYRYMSATIDLTNRIIKSVSLVNFPAVKGLKPVELSEGVKTFEQDTALFTQFKRWLEDWLKGRHAELADGIPGSITISQFLSATIHKVFTNCADNLSLSGYLSTEERIQLSSAIGDALDTFSSNLGDAGGRLIPSDNYYPERYFSEVTQTEEKPMTDEEKAALREKIRTEERQKVEAELKAQNERDAELREQIRKEERDAAEAELRERYERHAGLVEFAKEITGGEVGLSAKPEQVVEFLEKLPADSLETAKAMLTAKIVDFREHGSNGKGHRENGKKALPAHAREDIISGEFTVKDLFAMHELNLGSVDDYDLSDFSASQKGF